MCDCTLCDLTERVNNLDSLLTEDTLEGFRESLDLFRELQNKFIVEQKFAKDRESNILKLFAKVSELEKIIKRGGESDGKEEVNDG